MLVLSCEREENGLRVQTRYNRLTMLFQISKQYNEYLTKYDILTKWGIELELIVDEKLV